MQLPYQPRRYIAASTFTLFSITRDTSYEVFAFKEENQLHFTAITSSSSCLAGNLGSSSSRDTFVTRPFAKYLYDFRDLKALKLS